MCGLILLVLVALWPAPVVQSCEHDGNAFHLDFSRYTFQPHESQPGKLSPLENELISKFSSESAQENLKYLTSRSHMAGTRQDEILSRFMVSEFTRVGLDSAWVDPVAASISYPEHRPRLAVLSPGRDAVTFEAKLSEDLLDESSDVWERNHTFNGYSPSGNVTGRLVYANFGTPADFAVLERAKVRVRGRIVLVRYGRCFRGLKVMNAQQRGAIGVIIYSDPMEDGYSVGKVYPQGPWRPPSSVQRGSVQFNSLCSGDPWRSTGEHMCGYSPKQLVPSIPVLPISYEDAAPLLAQVDQSGNFPPGKDFLGALAGIRYALGPSPTLVWLQVGNTMLMRSVWNAFGLVKGRDYGTPADRPVILGNHRDAWVFGAADPNSGTAALLEVAKGLGHLRAQGWVPRRTLLLASWSGEELGLLGSTAFGEAQASHFLANAVAYLNVDIGVSGTQVFELGATATLACVVRDVLADLPDPDFPHQSVLARRWPPPHAYAQLATGSDHAVFIHHLGIPSVDMRFSPGSTGNGGKATAYGTYHAIYDSYAWMKTQGDPGFKFHVVMAQIWGVLAFRLAHAVRLPFCHLDQARAIEGFVHAVQKMVPSSHAFEAMTRAAQKYVSAAVEAGTSRKVQNDARAFSERRFLHPEGLPLRQWFRHVLQAPSLYLGYDSDFIPGVQQAFRDMNDSKLAIAQAYVFAARVESVASFLLAGQEA